MQKIHIAKEDFERILALGGQCISPTRTIPLSDYIRITGRDTNLLVEAISEICGIRARAKVSIGVEQEVSFCIQCKQLEQFIKAVSDSEVTLEIEEDSLKIIHSDGEFTFPIVPSLDYPTLQAALDDEATASYTVSSALLSKWLVSAKAFAANDQLRPVINGIYVYTEANGAIGFCAASQQAIICDETKCEGVQAASSFIIDKKAFPSILAVLKDSEEVTVTVTSKNVHFKTRNAKMVVHQTLGKFLNFKALYDKPTIHDVIFKRKALLDAMKRISLCCVTDGGHILISMRDNIARISFDNLAFNKKVSEVVPYEGECELSVIFALGNIEKSIAAIDTEDVLIRLYDDKRPVIINETGEGASENKSILITPAAPVRR